MDSTLARIRTALASPVGVLVAVPSLVALLGIAVALLALAAIRAQSEAVAKDVLVSQAAYVGEDTQSALGQAAPILSRIRDVAANDDPSQPLARVAPALHDSVLAHAGITYVSESFPDGTFRGAYVDKGAVLVQESRVGTGADKARRFAFDDGALSFLGEEPSTYDPRTRPFYALAMEKKARTWTAPYTFYDTHLTGITCTEPVFDANGALHAIITVDFDVNGLSAMLARSPYEGGRTIIFSQNGTILAYAAKGRRVPQPTADVPLRASDLGDPAIAAVVAAATSAPSGPPSVATVGAGDDAELVAFTSVKPPSRPATPDVWYVAALAPKAEISRPAAELQKRSILANAVAILLALAIAILLSRHIVRMRTDLQATKASLTTAEDRARELGSYRLVAKLGAGGQGEVWRAEHRLLAREAAIKLIRKDVAASDLAELRGRFRLEAQALASLKSRNTIELFDYGTTEDGVFFYVMELLDGLNLETLVAKHGPQPSARVIHILIQACASLAEAHDRKILHRDIKPANLFLCRLADEVDVIKVLDFGLVNPIGERVAPVRLPESAGTEPPSSDKLTEDGMVMGTPGFMAPEQARGGGGLDGRVDVYALGCVAWWLLAGKMVFERKTAMALVAAHIAEPVPSLVDAVPGWVSPELAMLVTSCLAKSRRERPATVRALAEALRSIVIPKEHAFGEEEARAWWTEREIPASRGAEVSQPVILVPE